MSLSRQEFKSLRKSQNTRRNQSFQKNYGITFRDYLKMFEDQSGKCKICAQQFGRFELEERQAQGIRLKLVVDHCHKTGRIRGLLCTHCNSGLGMFRDNPKALQAAVAYLENL